MEPQVKADGWASFAGGMHFPEGNHHIVGKDQAELLVNGTVRNGWLAPRPAFDLQSINWVDLKAQHVFESGVIQGAAFYDSDNGPRFVFAADGYLLSYDPARREMRVVSPDKEQCFHSHAPFVYLQQRGRWMVAQDGINRPVIIDGDGSYEETDPYNGVPTGLMMADGWHRLVVVAPDRVRLFISDHEFDPSSGPLKFTDDATYYKNAKWFQVPRGLGKIVGVEFAPSFNNQEDWGPLLVFCERGIRAYQLQVPRENWTDQDIAATILPTTGGVSHHAVVPRGNDVVFSDDEGRIQTFKAAITRRDDVRLKMADQAVWPLYKAEHAGLRRWRSAMRFDDRVLVTVQPERIQRTKGRTSVRHAGMVVMEEDHLSERPFVWAGLWTGIKPTWIVSGVGKTRTSEAPQEMAFAVSLDDDGVQRLYQITTRRGPDMVPAPRPVSMWAVPRWMEWGSIFDINSFNRGSLRFSGIRGAIQIDAKWQRDNEIPQEWFTHYAAGPGCLLFSDCAVQELASANEPNLKLPAPARDKGFYKARPWLHITGEAQLEEGQVIVDAKLATGKSTVTCAPQATVKLSDGCYPNYWRTEDSSLTNPSITIC